MNLGIFNVSPKIINENFGQANIWNGLQFLIRHVLSSFFSCFVDAAGERFVFFLEGDLMIYHKRILLRCIINGSIIILVASLVAVAIL